MHNAGGRWQHRRVGDSVGSLIGRSGMRYVYLTQRGAATGIGVYLMLTILP